MLNAATPAAWIAAMEASRELRGNGGPPLAEIPRLTDYHDVDFVLRSKDFVQAGGGHRENAPMTLHTVVSLSGDDHFQRRRLEAPVFGREALAACERETLEPAITNALAACFAAAPTNEVRADLMVLAREIFARVSARIVGIDLTANGDDVERFLRYAERQSDGHNVDWSSRDHAEVMDRALDAKRCFVEEFFVPSWQRRRDARRNVAAAPDLLTSLLAAGDHFVRWDIDTVVREIVLFLTAAIGSPARAVPYVVSELTGWLERHPEDHGKLADPEFLRGAVGETLRLHTPGAPKLRRARRNAMLPSGRAVRADDHVAADIAAANHDTAVFGTDAGTFNLRRHAKSVPPFGIAFGAGPHTCIGLLLTIGRASTDGSEPTGTMVRLLLELYRAGMRPDPDNPPRRQLDNPKRYATFPILLARTP